MFNHFLEQNEKLPSHSGEDTCLLSVALSLVGVNWSLHGRLCLSGTALHSRLNPRFFREETFSGVH